MNALESQAAGSTGLLAFPTQPSHLCKQAVPTLSSPAGLLATGIPPLYLCDGSSLDPQGLSPETPPTPPTAHSLVLSEFSTGQDS